MADLQPEATGDSYGYSHRVPNPFRVLLARWRAVRDMQNTYEAGIVEMGPLYAGKGIREAA
jgi:hypothetical protein